MARPVAGDYLKDGTPIFSAVAAPVDTYVKPQRSGASSAEALVSALSGLDKAIQPVLQRRFDKAKETEVAQGQQLWQENRQDFAEAVRTGAVPAGASPYVRKGYRTSQLHTLGANYATELARGLEESKLGQVDDPAQIEQYLADFHEKFSATNNLNGFDTVELASVFTPMATKAHDNFRLRQVEKNIQFVETERFTSFQNEVLATLDMQTFDGSRSQIDTAIAGTAEWLKAKADELDAEGLDRTKISKSVVDILTSAAEADEDLDILRVLEAVKLGTGPLANTQYGREQMFRTKERILSAQLRRQAASDRAQAKARAARVETISLEGMRAAIAGDEVKAAEAMNLLLSEGGDASEARALYSFTEQRKTGRKEEMAAGEWSRMNAEVEAAQTREEARKAIVPHIPYIGPDQADDLLRTWDRLHGKSGTPAEQRFFSFSEADGPLRGLQATIVGNEFDANDERRDRAAILGNEWLYAKIDWYDQNKREDGTFDSAAYSKFAVEWSKTMRDIYLSPENTTSDVLEVNKALQSRVGAQRLPSIGDIPD